MTGIYDTQEDDYMIVESRRSKVEGTKMKIISRIELKEKNKDANARNEKNT
jgi:hypothetical protein